jgi:hypothetical protein
MVFNRFDNYAPSGSGKLYNSWTPYVSKFDTSSFYNWEQDNLPLYDLEERTYELWEQQGYPTSSVPGLSLVVSADATTQGFQVDSNIFPDVSSCIRALPKVIRFPVQIEVCNFGDLGKIELHDLKFSEGGSLELVNRNFSRIYNASATVKAITVMPNDGVARVYFPTQYRSSDLSATLLSGIGDDVSTSALSISSLVFSAGDFNDTAASRLDGNINTVLYPKFSLRKGHLTVGIGDTVDTVFGQTQDATGFNFGVTPYELRADAQTIDPTIRTEDASCLNTWFGPTKGDQYIVRNQVKAEDNVAGAFYGNSAELISIYNCAGPVYLRNFFVDGEAAPVRQGTKTGIEVANSKGVVVENCTVVRCLTNGMHFHNSDVNISRSAFMYRNYDRTGGFSEGKFPGQGQGLNCDNGRMTFSSLQQYYTGEDEGGDYQAKGSDCIWVASRNKYGMRFYNTSVHGGYGRTNINDTATGGALISELNRNSGISLYDSHFNIQGLVDLYANYWIGLEVQSSNINVGNMCGEYHNAIGGRIRNGSNLWLNQHSCSGTLGQTSAIPWSRENPALTQSDRKQFDFNNNGQHLKVIGSEVGISFTSAMNDFCGQTSFSSCISRSWAIGIGSGTESPAVYASDGSHIRLANTKMIPRVQATTSELDSVRGMAACADNNSTIEFFGTGSGCTFIWGPPGFADQRMKAGVAALRNSTVNFFGPTVIAQWGVDALAEDHSEIRFSPPFIKGPEGTEIGAFDLHEYAGANHAHVELHSTRACVVANKNSIINMKNLGDYNPYWNNNPIGVVLQAAGQDYPTSGTGTNQLANDISGGSMQFYPNPANVGMYATPFLNDDLLAYGAAGPAPNNGATVLDIPEFPAFTNTGTGLWAYFGTQGNIINGTPSQYYTGGPKSIDKITAGGVCVRAVEDSQVNVLNVHFPTGPNDSPLDGIYYDTSSGECNRLMIWNMADTSKLNAAFCTVSGQYPADAQYHGPSALWTSAFEAGNASTDKDSYVIASGAPSSTPDTGILSVLDSFGAGSAVWFAPSAATTHNPFNFGNLQPLQNGVGTGLNGAARQLMREAGIPVQDGIGRGIMYGGDHAFNNRGLFRIYFSPDPVTRLLANDLSGYHNGNFAGTNANTAKRIFSGIAGPAYQIYAQGYNMSANVSALEGVAGSLAVSAYYPRLLKLSLDNNSNQIEDGFTTSGFYYNSEFLADDPTQCILDESAQNTFANAKNASIGTSGRAKRVTRYRSRASTDIGSDSSQGQATTGAVPAAGAEGPGDRGTEGFKSANIFDLERDN